VDNRYAPPVQLEGVVHSIHQGDQDAEVEVVVQVGSLKVIVTKKRKPYHHISDFTNLKLDPTQTDILVVKIGYLVPELYDILGDWVMALTPGGVDQDLQRLAYKNIRRPMFPLDSSMDSPDLSVRWIPLSGTE
jgi:microcystin degradation protein MlrC